MNGKYKYVTIASLLSAAVLLGTGCTMTEQKQNDTAKTQNTANASKDAKDQKADSNLEDQEFILESKYFNQIKDVDGLPTIQNPENIMALVNKEYALPGNYAPSDLTVPDVAFSFTEDIDKRYIRKEAAKALEEMFSAAKKEGYELVAVSGYRSYDRQKAIYNNEVSQKGEKRRKKLWHIRAKASIRQDLRWIFPAKATASPYQRSSAIRKTDNGSRRTLTNTAISSVIRKIKKTSRNISMNLGTCAM